MQALRIAPPRKFAGEPNFLEKCNDISFLADLLGHESIETTRIYLRRTTIEQRSTLDRIVTW